ncbi:MAG: ribonuclease H-like domain-containing protein [Clostridia bacterium]|nr:ribonuclease H-like domain-containing protein [Clostridia bacterium]
MYLDLKSKLQMYKANTEKSAPVTRKQGPDVDELLAGTIYTSEDGSFFIVENTYPLTYLHGGCNLGSIAHCDISPVLKACHGTTLSLRAADFAFLDTETTGLSGGTGTVAFLIGIGFFTEEAFVLRQYFMRDYDEEYPMLLAINQLLSSFKGLITFNGKSFDWNLLLTRFTSNRIRPVLKTPVHLDLLYPSRTLWKLKLESCRLGSLEENILGEYRIDDIPGALIPSVYFKYLDDRDASEIKKVIVHNEKDILSMVSLLTRINSILSNPLAETKDSWELLGAGKIFEKLEQGDHAADCYHHCKYSDIHTVKETSMKKLAGIYKRNKEFEKSIEQLKLLLANASAPNIPVMIELAKQYEHRIKDTKKALETVQAAIDLCSQAGFLRNMYYSDLKSRLERLKKKNQKRSI